MLVWNYRIVQKKNGDYFLSEVLYNSKGEPFDWNDGPYYVFSDAESGPDKIISDLEIMLKDAKSMPVLKVEDINGEADKAEETDDA